MQQDFDLNLLKRYITNKDRIAHSLSVAENMMKYASLFDINKHSAYFAGFYHDIAKEQSHDNLIVLSKSFVKRKILNVNYFDFKYNAPSLLHGIGSAEIVIRELGVANLEEIEAICSHTLGGQDLCKLSMYTFIFDFCEPLRKYKGAKRVANTLLKDEDFDRAYLQTYIEKIEQLISKNREICPESVEGYNNALSIIKARESNHLA